MSEEVIREYARELAAKAYNARAAEYPDEISLAMEQENVKKSLEDLSIFIQQCTKAGKKVVLCIEFGICRFERFRFKQITKILMKREFEEYDSNALYIILGIDADFTNYSMLQTMRELIDRPLSEEYRLVNRALLEEDSRRFQVTPLPGEEADVSKGNANLYFFQIEKVSRSENEELFLGSQIYHARNGRAFNEESRKLSFYTYFIKHEIKTSYFNACEEVVRYYKAQQSDTIDQFSRNSRPKLPFWKALRTLCWSSISKIYYVNIAHLDDAKLNYIQGLRKVYNILLRIPLRFNKYSEKMSEIWNILTNIISYSNEIPIFLLDLDLDDNRTFETQGASQFIVKLKRDIAFKKQDEIPRIFLTTREFNSLEDFFSVPREEINLEQATPAIIESIDWDSLCADPPEPAEGGGKQKRKSKKQSNKTKSRGRKRGTRKGR